MENAAIWTPDLYLAMMGVFAATVFARKLFLLLRLHPLFRRAHYLR